MGAAAQTLAAGLLGIVFLMTVKPGLIGAIGAMAVSLLLGLLSSLPLWRHAQLRRAHRPDLSGSPADPYLRKTFWTRRW
jgi:hypothetical protein